MTDSLDEQFALWGAQRDQRIHIGDALDQPREIEHFANFRGRGGADAAAAELAAVGFTTEVRKSLLRSALVARRDETLTD